LGHRSRGIFVFVDVSGEKKKTKTKEEGEGKIRWEEVKFGQGGGDLGGSGLRLGGNTGRESPE